MTKTAIICTMILMLATGCRVQHQIEEDTRLYYGQKVISARYHRMIDSLIHDAIERRAMPGCRIIAAIDHQIILDQCYGYLDYDSTQRVTDSTLYDLASVTKVAASSLALMAMYDDGKIQLDRPLCKYLAGITENGATLRDALAHQAGFKPWLPLRTMLKDLSNQMLDSTQEYNTEAARQQIINTIVSQPLADKGNYAYSDLGFYIYPEFVKKYYGMDFETFLYTRFYNPLGISPLYNPLRQRDISYIAPTENDSIWRKRIVRGTVHDEGAALMGGISGHAGLFGTAKDVAVIMQLILNKGEYGGRRLIKESTVELFTSQAFDGNRRGLVFDKPLLDPTLNGTPSPRASKQSYGHTGFTGSLVWADPRNKLLLIFLCNSTFPCRSTMLSRLNVRTQLHDIFYNSDILDPR